MLNTPLKPMLLQPAPELPTGDNYSWTIKYDGHRALLHYKDGRIRIFTRHKNEVTQKYIEFDSIKLPVQNCILDGEMICFDTEKEIPVPCFDSLMTRFQASNPTKIAELTQVLPVQFVSFDIIYLNDKSLLNEPYYKRISLLNNYIPNQNNLSVAPVYSDGDTLYNRVVDLDLEGVVTRDNNKPYYLDSRPNNVIFKTKNYQYSTVSISGIRKEKFGWLMKEDNKYRGILEFVPPDERKAFYHISKQLIIDEDKDFIYLDPLIKCEVKYQCLSKNGYMRSASFQKFIV